MSVEKEEFLNFPEDIKNCLKGRGVENVDFDIRSTDQLINKTISGYLPEIVSELTDNCMDKGAKNIVVTLTDTSLRVEDDVIEEDPEKKLKLLNKIINTKKGITTKDKMRIASGSGPGGGMGIAAIVIGYLERVGGKLKYFSEGGRIIAEADWE